MPLGLDKSKFDVVDFRIEDNAINNKQNGVRGRSPINFTTNFLNCVKFLLNHHRNIVIPKSLVEGEDRLVGGGAIAPSPYGSYGPVFKNQ